MKPSSAAWAFATGVRHQAGGGLAVVLACAMALWSATSLADARGAKVNFRVDGRVLAIEDGDTLTLRGAGGGDLRIRLADIDAPEAAHAHNPYARDGERSGRHECPGAPRAAPGQPGGAAATRALNTLAPVGAAARAECYETDAYGRLVCHVFVGTRNVNLELLREGLAMTAPKARWIRDPASRTAAHDARAARRGIWQADSPRSPSRWRRKCWCQGQCAGAEPSP